MIPRDKCPFCEGTSARQLYEIAYDAPEMRAYLESFYASGEGVDHAVLAGCSYQVMECPACAGLYQHHVPGDALMLELYDKWIDPAAPLKRKAGNPLSYYASASAEIMQLLSLLGKPPGQVKVLDFGSGWNEWALAARGLGCEVTVCELSETRLAHARAHGLPVIDYAAIAGAGFDLINTEQVLEHVPDPLVIVRHLLGGLAQGGMLKISVPDCDDFKQRLKRADWTAPKGSKHSLNPLAPLEHLNLFRPETLATMARLAGARTRKVPVATQLRNATHWHGASRIARNLVMPFWRNFANRKNYTLLSRG
ncbi:MAG: class I SAM-dependent methyltransferase [Erythrobacter sp.]|nr:class I SAM-dependent methyltransferase [Erythrobacter sp.]